MWHMLNKDVTQFPNHFQVSQNWAGKKKGSAGRMRENLVVWYNLMFAINMIPNLSIKKWYNHMQPDKSWNQNDLNNFFQQP